ncbi:transglycosylase domain-containing protein [Actinotignum schaalii]|uniref:transglycosylase domain-containing protein n=1 Tax=Actinotignum schaalii TaxID=59505 RepID=UPI00047CB612|nr:transglycosylase domain-containing protein [Actinotignum schaalii]AIE82956.1 penicillin-binding protein [Actinotignum schaalii]WQN45099.1 transglycosylase domain-containing protein [Actinotignum schaalii]
MAGTRTGRTQKGRARTQTGRNAAPAGRAGARQTEARRGGTRQGGTRRKRPIWNYPRRGKGPIHRWIPSWRFVLGLFFTLGFGGLVALVTLYIFLPVPSPDDIATAEKTTLYYRDGSTELGSMYEVNRTPVPLESLPDYIGNAVVASEDRTFYSNSGIDLGGIARAVVNNIRGGARQGGSTLTQQYVENYYLGTTTDYIGKVKEAVLAVKVDRNSSKQDILENYLNTIYFGRGAYGIESAAQNYFGIPAAQLSLDQAALLTAVIPAPSAWDPAVDPERAAQRFDRVINRMLEDGYITAEQAAAATMPATIEYVAAKQFSGTNGYLLAAAQQELIATEKFTEDSLNRGGYTIVTTIDPTMQQAAVDVVNALPKDRPENNYVGMLSADPSTGGIYAMYAGADYQERQRNTVTQDRAQAGSTFKPFGALAALKQGKSIDGTYYNSPAELKIGDITISNFDDANMGTINMRTATANSVNTYYAQLNEEVGPRNTRAAAIEAGIPESTPGLDNSLTNVLGSASPTNKELTQAFAGFANRGVSVPLHLVSEVRDAQGTVVYRADTAGKRVLDQRVADNLNELLQEPTGPRGTADRAGRLGFQVAGKTGTSTDLKSAWFVGYNPKIITTVNMFQIGPNGEEESLGGWGAYPWGIGGNGYPVDMWVDFMKAVTGEMDLPKFPEPELIGDKRPSYRPTRPEPVEEVTTTPEPSAEPTEQPAPATEEPEPEPSATVPPELRPTRMPAPPTETIPLPTEPAERERVPGAVG